MKNLLKHLLITACALISFSCTAGISKQELLTVNKNWQTQPSTPIICFDIDTKITGFNYSIAQHLLNVINTISTNENTNALNEKTKQRKIALLNTLKTYAYKGAFPINDYLPCQNPVFIDRRGTHCAVGYLLQQSGYENIAQDINATQQFAFINEIKNKKLNAWAKEYGFTKDELAWIQPAYPSDLPTNAIDSGVDGTVNTICKIDTNTYIIGGSFNKLILNNQVSKNLALLIYDNGTWHLNPIPNGTNGPVYAITKHLNILVIGGKFSNVDGLPAQNICAYNPLTQVEEIVC
jgi:hypothetical protein